MTAARPTGILQTQTSLETIGSIVNHIPTAITHQSRTEIHNQQPVISQIIAPVLRSIPVETILQANPIIASQIQPSVLLEQNQQQILSGQEGQAVIGEEQTAEINEQRELLQNQAALIGGQRIIVGDNRELTENNGASVANDQGLILSNSESLANTINTSELQLNGNIKALGR